MIRAIARMFAFGPVGGDPEHYVPHGPITAEIAAELLANGVWTCRQDTDPATDRPGEIVRPRWWSPRTVHEVQCQCCQAILHAVDGKIPAHEPADPTEVYCPGCQRPYNEDLEPVYMGKESPPLCDACSLADPIGYDDDGMPVHGAPTWLDDPVA